MIQVFYYVQFKFQRFLKCILDLSTLFLEIANSQVEGLSAMQCAMKTHESSFHNDIASRGTAFKFVNKSCTLGKTPNYHDAFWNKTTNEDSAVYVAINTKPLGKRTGNQPFIETD